MIAEFVIHAAPMGKARPRVTVHGTYTPKKTKDYEQLIRTEYGLQCRDLYFGGVPIQVSIIAFFEPPKSASKKARAEMLSGMRPPTKKPDADNIAKAVCDALNGCAWYDDAQIVSMIVVKEYGETGHVRVMIQEVGNEKRVKEASRESRRKSRPRGNRTTKGRVLPGLSSAHGAADNRCDAVCAAYRVRLWGKAAPHGV